MYCRDQDETESFENTKAIPQGYWKIHCQLPSTLFHVCHESRLAAMRIFYQVSFGYESPEMSCPTQVLPFNPTRDILTQSFEDLASWDGTFSLPPSSYQSSQPKICRHGLGRPGVPFSKNVPAPQQPDFLASDQLLRRHLSLDAIFSTFQAPTVPSPSPWPAGALFDPALIMHMHVNIHCTRMRATSIIPGRSGGHRTPEGTTLFTQQLVARQELPTPPGSWRTTTISLTFDEWPITDSVNDNDSRLCRPLVFRLISTAYIIESMANTRSDQPVLDFEDNLEVLQSMRNGIGGRTSKKRTKREEYWENVLWRQHVPRHPAVPQVRMSTVIARLILDTQHYPAWKFVQKGDDTQGLDLTKRAWGLCGINFGMGDATFAKSNITGWQVVDKTR
ncbi:hypothetical protein QBC41DRAFT_329161 [Cercophora samala]|uniref:2EXR domain-containing protein n=1 Tax=Cercophora samala TaxID=330535 RepID=A0AA39Z4E6_9PEZI|nr:hypothetical protein QBC41DRAFT_329161 [Cercophora samala]